MGRRRADDDDEAWADVLLGEANMGHIAQLTEKEPPGWPFEVKRGPMGFDVTKVPSSAAINRRKRRKR